MKVLVLGSKSFLAKEIFSFFSDKNFNFIDRSILNLENTNDVNEFFNKNYYDFVINTCVSGGKYNIIDNYSVLSSNILMFNNLLNNKNKFGNLFNFCSGAAFDRRTDIQNAPEEKIYTATPEDYYGLSKNIISKESKKHNNIYTFRIFGCFGIYETETRFIKNSLKNLNNNQPIIIYKDKYMDFFSSYDLCKVLDYYMNNINCIQERDINLVYNKKYKLSDIAKKILNLKNTNNHAIIQEKGLDKSYTGDGSRLSTLPINLKGLDQSLKEIAECQI